MKFGFGFLKKKKIHPEDGFLEGENRFWISRSIGKSGFRFSNLNPDFPIERTPSDSKIIGIKTYLFENFSRKKGSRKF